MRNGDRDGAADGQRQSEGMRLSQPAPHEHKTNGTRESHDDAKRAMASKTPERSSNGNQHRDAHHPGFGRFFGEEREPEYRKDADHERHGQAMDRAGNANAGAEAVQVPATGRGMIVRVAVAVRMCVFAQRIGCRLVGGCGLGRHSVHGCSAGFKPGSRSSQAQLLTAGQNEPLYYQIISSAYAIFREKSNVIFPIKHRQNDTFLFDFDAPNTYIPYVYVRV